MSRENVCAAANAAISAVSPEERVSLIWDGNLTAISFSYDGRGWFWVAYDRKAGRVAGHGRAATIEAAVEQAWDATRLPALAAE